MSLFSPKWHSANTNLAKNVGTLRPLAFSRFMSQQPIRMLDIPFMNCYVEPKDEYSVFTHPYLKLRQWWRSFRYRNINIYKSRYFLRRNFPGRAFNMNSIVGEAVRLHSSVNCALASHDSQVLENNCTLRASQILRNQLKQLPKCEWKVEKHLSSPKLLNLSCAQADMQGNEFFIQAIVRLHTLQSVSIDQASPSSKRLKEEIENVVIQQCSWIPPVRWQFWGLVSSTAANAVKKKLPDGQTAFVELKISHRQ
ncbi:respiratory complex assembly protein [Schizosaccharomyces cryophilus OY26]|uniref:Respiratory complex assembly protein n=1 Tax=Schizosaccharomyces cryophilus (strain OY26 / ATCC MYA-4695 / CBS 11777 / NBRC 106824 / NRRL Y48691) TaxID=653667 RepID=S9VW51_SCHCR|nr:respiratory complex assembly protein [Schizosaccharomyces cryophilus OY26]EPY51828.1 respiratory complex assembly protein [Schizosaccharomyces cryophilus OY26]